MTSTLDKALALASEGIAVFPCKADKSPACPNGFKDASRDPETIRRLFSRPGAELIGVPTGAINGFDALDLDPRHGSDLWLKTNKLPITRIHSTRSGGLHVLFRHVEGVRNSASRIAAGLDVRGDGGFIIHWPSAGCEVWLDEPIAPWPPALLDAALRRPPAAKADRLARAAHNPSTDEAKAALATGVREIEDAPPGERYETVKRLTWQLSKLVLGGFLDEDDMRTAVVEAAEAAGGEDMGKVERLIDGALEKVEPAIEGGSEFDALPPIEDDEPVPRPGRRPLRERLLFPADCEHGPRRGYIVKGLIAPGDVIAITGHPGSGKSILAPHLAYALAQGRPVFGMRTKPGAVLYAAAEDHSGMRQRIAALRRKHGDAPDFAIVDIGNLKNKAEADELLDYVRSAKPALVVIDTLGAAWAGMDENSPQDMGDVVRLTRSIAATGAAVMLVHHVAKHGDGSPRGHSVLNGTLDASVLLSQGEDGIIRAKLMKNRNGSCALDIAFKIEAAALGTDEDGDPITAPIADELPPQAGRRLPKLSVTEAAALRALRHVAKPAPDGTTAADRAEWLDHCKSAGVSSAPLPKSRGIAINRAMVGLAQKGVITLDDHRAVLVANAASEFEPLTDEPVPLAALRH